MKTIINSDLDIIIKHSSYCVSRDEKGKVIWLDEEKKLTNVKNKIDRIFIYSHTTINEFGQTIISVVNLNEYDIERLYNKIQELKNTEYIGEINDDDLPF